MKRGRGRPRKNQEETDMASKPISETREVFPFAVPLQWDDINQSINDANGVTVAMVGFSEEDAKKIDARERGMLILDILNGNKRVRGGEIVTNGE